MKKINVKIYGLKGCQTCEQTVKKLQDLKIPIEFVECGGYNEECHNLELLTGTYGFPIVIVGDTIIYFILQYSSESKKKKLNDKYYGLEALTTHEFLGRVVDEYKKQSN